VSQGEEEYLDLQKVFLASGDGLREPFMLPKQRKTHISPEERQKQTTFGGGRKKDPREKAVHEDGIKG